MKFIPPGARILVDPIITTVSLEKRAEVAGLSIVLEHDNVPRPTQGRVIALGSDPLMREEINEGDVVFFDWHSGTREVILEGKAYIQLEHQEVTGLLRKEDVKTSNELEVTQAVRT